MLLELLDLSLAAYCIVPDKMEKVEREAYEMDAQFEIDNRWNHRDSVPSRRMPKEWPVEVSKKESPAFNADISSMSNIC